LCVITSQRRGILDGGDVAGERLIQWIRNPESPWRTVPLMLLAKKSSIKQTNPEMEKSLVFIKGDSEKLPNEIFDFATKLKSAKW